MKSLLLLPMRRLLASRSRIVYSVAVAACAFVAACDSKSTTAPPVLTTLAVSPNPQQLAIGATQQFTAAGKDASGASIAVTPTWSVSAGGGTISSTGLFTAGTTPGTFTNTVVATSGSVTSSATVTVVAGALATIAITPSNDTTIAGGTKQFTAVGRDASGNVVTIAAPVWSIANGGGTISATGLFTAGGVAGAFPATIKVTSGTITATANETIVGGALATVVVTPVTATVGTTGTQQFVATGRDAAGNVVAITPVWSVAAGGGTISATGLFTAGTTSGVFTNTVRATSGALSGTATVTVTAGALASIAVTPTPISVAFGASVQLTATGQDAAGNPVAITPAWSVVNGGGTIDAATGLFTAGSTLGVFANTVRVSSGSIVSTVSVTVTSGALSAITITPASVTLGANATQQFTAVGRDAGGNVVVITPVWSIVASGGTIGSTGLFTAGATPGVFTNTVRVASGAISATASVTVVSGALATITVTPSNDTTPTSGVKQFTAVGRDAAGNVVAMTPVWSVVNGGGSINSTTGVFTAGTVAGTYNNTIRATSGAIIGSANEVVTSNAAILATVSVSPNAPVIAPNGTQQFIATGRDAAGNVIPITATWSVVNAGGTITSTGLFTAGATAGTYTGTVRATSGVVSGTSTVIVSSTSNAPTVSLGTAAANGVMAGTTASCVTGGIINGNLGVSPGTTSTGFGPCAINGVQNLGNATAAQAQLDLTTAYNALVAMPCPANNVIINNLGGTTRLGGVYCSTTGLIVNGTLTLDGGGDVNAVWVFQSTSTLTGVANIVFVNGAQAKNVYWQVGSSATLGAASQWQGNIIALTNITLLDNATVFGRVLARNGAVTLGSNNIVTVP